MRFRRRKLRMMMKLVTDLVFFDSIRVWYAFNAIQFHRICIELSTGVCSSDWLKRKWKMIERKLGICREKINFENQTSSSRVWRMGQLHYMTWTLHINLPLGLISSISDFYFFTAVKKYILNICVGVFWPKLIAITLL